MKLHNLAEAKKNKRYIIRQGRESPHGYGQITYWADRQTYAVWAMTDRTEAIMLCVQKTFSVEEAKAVLDSWEYSYFEPNEEAVIELVTAEILQGAADDDWTQ